MSVLEREVLREDLEDVDEFVCHVYRNWQEYALCGLHESEDKHGPMHAGATALPEHTCCPVCQTPICKTCRQEFLKLKRP